MAAQQMPSPADSASAPEAATPAFSPLYQQIKGLITRSLQSGEWKPGEAIPSEMELAARYKVSQGTVRKAIDAMAAENLLIRRQGKGTFVATHAERPQAGRDHLDPVVELGVGQRLRRDHGGPVAGSSGDVPGDEVLGGVEGHGHTRW